MSARPSKAMAWCWCDYEGTMTKTKGEILKEFSVFSIKDDGIGQWLSSDTHNDVFLRLGEIDNNPLSQVQFNQLLVLGREAPVSDAFFRYYWLMVPPQHPYCLQDLPGYSENWSQAQSIMSLDHLKWGL